MDKSLVYLACPYSLDGRDGAKERERRFNAVSKVAAQLMEQGHSVFSPISHGHPIALNNGHIGWERWQELDRAILTNCCRRMIVLMLEGWQQSLGLAQELKIARELKLPVSYIDPVKWLMNENERR